VLGVSETCDLGSLYLRLIAEGHRVKVAVSEPLAAGTMAGMVERCADWRAELNWVRQAGSDGLVLFEAVGFGALQDELRREGFQVIGGSALGDRLEEDRRWSLEVLGETGLPIAPTAEFTSAEEALADLRARPRRCVFKRSASDGATMVGTAADGSDIAALLTVRPPRPGEPFVLMDHVDGVETGVGAWFNGERFLLPACLDWEHKHFFAGGMGELTGEMGTVATFEGAERLFEAALLPIEPLLREAGHVGWINLNTIVNADGAWPIEFTCRFGYPGYAVLEPLQALRWGDLLRAIAGGDPPSFPTHGGFSVGVVLTTPPFPYSRKELDLPVGFPVSLGAAEPDSIHLGEVGMVDDRLVTSGLYGWTAVATGIGRSVEAARDVAYRTAAEVSAPSLRYRLDIGDRLIAGELERLAEWGWLKSVPPSRIASQMVR
jgi:phosphoribosylamine---glycine ligase